MSELIHNLGIDWKLLLANAVTFLIVLWVLRKFAFGPIMRALEQRQGTIAKGLADAKQQTEALAAFEEETLGALLEHEGAAELIHTLEVYFEHHGNLSQTAEALYVHRNTLIYRMDRIAAITHLDLDQPEDRLALQLALRIHRMLGERNR